MIMETAGVDVGPTTLCPVTGLVEEAVRTGLFCAFANTRATVGTVFGIGAFDNFECHLIRVALWVSIRGCGCKPGLS